MTRFVPNGFLSRPNDDRVKILGMGAITAVVCAVLVSATSILLNPIQEANLAAERQARMEAMLTALPGLGPVLREQGIDALQIRAVDLTAGTFADGIDAATLSPIRDGRDPASSVELPPGTDLAGLKRRATHAPVYLLESDGALSLIVLPVHGQGYQSTLQALLALEPDLNTIAALSITSQGETPGLGARIEDATWQALWPGKELANAAGEIVISVVRGQGEGVHQVDGISGATRTSLGIEAMLRFWMGPEGYGPFLERLQREGL